jgi:hypothetical protein
LAAMKTDGAYQRIVNELLRPLEKP